MSFADRIPASLSRRRYKTVDERCRACTLYGGREQPCESEDRRKQRWQKRYGQRCPRVDLDPENRVAMRLAQLLMSEESRSLAPQYLDAAGPRSKDEQARLMMIVSGALNDKRVHDARRELIDRQAQKKTPGPNERVINFGEAEDFLASVEVKR